MKKWVQSSSVFIEKKIENTDFNPGDFLLILHFKKASQYLNYYSRLNYSYNYDVHAPFVNYIWWRDYNFI